MLKSRQLDAIGEEITACRVQCEGTINEPKEGIYPRGFFPDVDNKESPHFDAVVIGLNPGTASHLEMTFTKYVQEREGCMKYRHIKTVLKPIVKSAREVSTMEQNTGKLLNIQSGTWLELREICG